MPDLPTGTVTFLFTDVEGSTRLLDELGAERYAEALAQHRRALRASFGRHGGVEVDTQGDAFFVAFADAAAAVSAAADAGSALAAGPIRVRIGVHTGEPLVTDEGYVGIDVHRGARLAAAGHGGQVLLSETTRAALDGGAELRDLGEQRLKDLGAPVRIYQLGDGDYPPLKVLYRSTLPVQPSPLVGRDRELAEGGRLLGEHRLLTLTGAGGSGKTRLALQLAAEAADDFPDGVYWVPLQAVRDAELVLPAVAQALGAQGDPAGQVADKRLLLVIDNLEQLLDSAPQLSELLKKTPNLKLLCTSRELLHIEGEREYPVDPMPLDDAVRLFQERAVQHEPADAVHEICRRLDCLPLAVELAAARTNVLAPAALLDRLGQALPILTGGRRDAPDRQRTLRAAIDWSHELLAEAERLLFRRLAVFAGSFDVDAAETVADADLDALAALVDKSLLRRWESGRFGMLDTIHEYAREQLEASGEADRLRERHAAHFLALAESAGLAAEDEVPQRHDLVIADQSNIRAALDFFVQRREVELALRLGVALENFWVTNNPAEGVRRMAALLEWVDEVPPLLRARALRVYSSPAVFLGQVDAAADALERSLAGFRALGDEHGVAIILHRLAVGAAHRGDTAQARALCEESIALHRRSGSKKGECQPIGLLAHLEHDEGRVEAAIELMTESVALARDVGFSWWHCGNALQLAEWALELGKSDEAERWGREALPVAHGIGDRLHCMGALMLLSRLAAEAGQLGRAGRLWGALEAEEARVTIPLPPWWAENRALHDPAAGTAADSGFDAGRAEGRRLALDEAVAAALDEP